MTTVEAPAGQTSNGHAEPPPGVHEVRTIIRLMQGAFIQQALYVAAKLGVADLLADGPRRVEELAAQCGAHAESLYRFLRALCAVDVFAEPQPRTFALNSVANYLRADWPQGHKWIVIQHGEESYRAFGEALHTARTGEPAWDRVFGKPIFEWLADHPDRRAELNKAAAATTDVPLVAADIDVSGVRRVVDVCGGQGRLLGTLLRRAPEATGVLFDLPEALADAPPILAEYDVAGRVETIHGDAFESVPAGGDLYTISRALHDFDDAKVRRLLANVAAAARPGARLAVLDGLMPEIPGYNPAKTADLIMMVIHGGRFYTLDELRDQLDEAGFEVTDVRHAPPGVDPRAESLVIATLR